MAPLRTAVTWMARSPLRAFLLVFLVGFSVRFFFLMKASERSILPHDRWEDAAIATAIVERGEFADPYMIPTGPTSHLPPLVPGILAFFWGLFGMGLAGGYAAELFSITTVAALYGLLPWFGGRLGLGREAGVLAGFAGALMAGSSGNREELAGLFIGLLAVAFVHRWTKGLGSFPASFLLGAASAITFHLQPALLPVVLGWMMFELWWSHDGKKWRLSGVMALGMFVACVPWGWRNYTVFDEAFFIRGNLGLELRMGNHEGATGDLEKIRRPNHEYQHPRANLAEAVLVQELGEAEYMRRAKAEAIDWITDNPGDFLVLTASRVTQFWLGPFHQPGVFLVVSALSLLALAGAWRSFPAMTPPQRAAVLVPLICYPVVYYIVIYMPRYRVPLNWILLVLAGAAVWRWLEGRARDATPGSP